MTATAASNLPSIDQWMVLRAKLAAVLGDEPASTSLSVLPSPIDGGFASNGRLDLMESRLRTEIVQASADTLKSMRALFFQLVGVMCTLGGFAIAAAKLL